MNLNDWINTTGTKEEALASAIGVSQAAVNRYRRQRRVPRLPVAMRIVAVTEGQVSLADLIGTPATSGKEEPACP